MTNTTRFQLGTPDQECRYPVQLDGQHLGRIYRWHGAWYAVPAGQIDEIRVAAGSIGRDAAAQYLVDEFDAGRLTPQQLVEDTPTKPRDTFGPVPLLHPRMPATARNTAGARVAMAGLAEYQWTPMGGYPGADNPWYMKCDLCQWEGPRYWSHLRGRNNNPPSPFRHPGCVDAEKVRSQIAAYQN